MYMNNNVKKRMNMIANQIKNRKKKRKRKPIFYNMVKLAMFYKKEVIGTCIWAEIFESNGLNMSCNKKKKGYTNINNAWIFVLE